MIMVIVKNEQKGLRINRSVALVIYLHELVIITCRDKVDHYRIKKHNVMISAIYRI